MAPSPSHCRRHESVAMCFATAVRAGRSSRDTVSICKSVRTSSAHSDIGIEMYIAIEGCVGVGKSTVATGLARYRGARVLLENFEVNPFLGAFYQNPAENTLETEFAFLLLHYHQLKPEKLYESAGEVVADFHLGKDLLYANLNLKDARALKLFDELYALCSEATPCPSLYVYLAASNELLVRRIAARKRDLEANVDSRYFAAVNEAYEELFVQYAGPKLRVSMDEWDFVKNESFYQKLSLLVDRELKLK